MVGYVVRPLSYGTCLCLSGRESAAAPLGPLAPGCLCSCACTSTGARARAVAAGIKASSGKVSHAGYVISSTVHPDGSACIMHRRQNAGPWRWLQLVSGGH